MRFVIVGCGRVGSTLAENLDAEGHEVTIFDVRSSAFDRLPETFKGSAVRGDGTDEEVLRGAGAEGADVFLSLTEGDNRNIMAAQLAIESLAIRQVIAKINDPVRAAAYSELGVVTLCRTNLMVDSVAQYLKLPMRTGPGIDIPAEAGHAHPHPGPTRRTVAPAVAPTGGSAAAKPKREAPAAAKPKGEDPAAAVRAERLGFRRRGPER
jgi:trk system potassium uptake protein TrkA